MESEEERITELSDSSLGREGVIEIHSQSSQNSPITRTTPVLISSDKDANNSDNNVGDKPGDAPGNYVEHLDVNSLSPWNPTTTQRENAAIAENTAAESNRKRSKHSRSHSHSKEKKHHKKKKKKNDNDETTESGKSHKKRRKSKHQRREKIQHTLVEEAEIEAFLVKPKDQPNESNNEKELLKSPVSVIDIDDTPIDSAGDYDSKKTETKYQDNNSDLHMVQMKTNISSPEADSVDKLSRTSNVVKENEDRQRRHSTNSKSSLSESGKRSRERYHGKRRHGSKTDRHGSHSPHRRRRSRSKSIQQKDIDATILSNKHREETDNIRHRKRHRRHTSEDHHKAHKSMKNNTTSKSVTQFGESDQLTSPSNSQSRRLHKKKRPKHEKTKDRKKKIDENLKTEFNPSAVVIEKPELDNISDDNEDMEVMEDAFNSMEAVHSLNIIEQPTVNMLETISDESNSKTMDKTIGDTTPDVAKDTLNIPLAAMDYDLIPVSPNKSSPELMIDTDDDSNGDVIEDTTPPTKKKTATLTNNESHYASFISPEPAKIAVEKPEEIIPQTNVTAAMHQASDTKDDLFEDIFGSNEETATIKDEFSSLLSTTASSFVYSPSHPTSLPSSPKQEEKNIITVEPKKTLIPDEHLQVSHPKPKEKLPFMMDSDDEDDIEYQLEKSAEQKRKALMELQIARERDTTIPLLFDSKPIEVPIVTEPSLNNQKLPLIQDNDDELDLVMSPESNDEFEIPMLDMEEKDDSATSLEPFQEIMRRKLEQQARRDKKIEKELEKKSKVTKEHKLVNFLVRQAKVEEEMKSYLKDYYRKKEITKEEYKAILKKAVPQVTMSQSRVIPEKIESLMKKYVCKVKGQRKKYGKATFLY